MFAKSIRQTNPYVYIVGAIVGTIALLAAPLAMAAPVTTELLGSEEVPPVSTETTGEFSIEFDDESAEYSLDVFDGEDITAAHLHCAEEGEEGPVVVTLFTSSSASGTDVDGLLVEEEIEDDEIASAGEDCDDPITDLESLADAIEAGGVYANVHNVEFPDGLIRGQLEGTTTDDDNGTTTDDDDNGTTTDDGTDDDDDDNGTTTDDGTDDDDDNGTTTDDDLDEDDALNSLDRLSELYERLLDLYAQLFGFSFSL